MRKTVIMASVAGVLSLGVLGAQASDRVCLGLGADKEQVDFNSWLQARQVEGADTNTGRARLVYNESVVTKWVRKLGPVFVFRPHKLEWTYYNGGIEQDDGIANGGKSYCPDLGRSCRTPSGVYTLFRKGGGIGCRSSKFPLNRGKARAWMPFCMFFKGGYAMHGSKYINPKRHGSHGCIRLEIDDAKWLYKNMPIGTKVIITHY